MERGGGDRERRRGIEGERRSEGGRKERRLWRRDREERGVDLEREREGEREAER